VLKKNTRSKFRPEYPKEFKFDYKDPLTLNRFIMEGGKIIPLRISKLSLSQQKALALAVKRARSLALVPIGSNAYDTIMRTEQVSPKPIEL